MKTFCKKMLNICSDWEYVVIQFLKIDFNLLGIYYEMVDIVILCQCSLFFVIIVRFLYFGFLYFYRYLPFIVLIIISTLVCFNVGKKNNRLRFKLF